MKQIYFKATVQPAAGHFGNAELHYLTDFTSHMSLIIVSLAYSFLSIKTYQLPAEEVNVYPYYLSMYTIQFIGISLMCSVACVIQYLRHPQMRKTLFSELNDLYHCME